MMPWERLQLEQAYAALVADGWRLTTADDGGEDYFAVETLTDLMDCAESVDISQFLFERGDQAGWIYVVRGNGPDDGTIADYHCVLDVLDNLEHPDCAKIDGLALDELAALLMRPDVEIPANVAQILEKIVATTGR